MSAIFQRPLCDMGKAYDFSFRSVLGDPEAGFGGPCDDRPRKVDLYSATADPRAPAPEWRIFELCPEHEDQLRRIDASMQAKGIPSRFRSSVVPSTAPASVPSGARR
ncbi:MAG TPA: hypothetical protein VMC82_00475 [Thermoplasmata archaeon]|nr:hypothetical protein [Thermoplasmata archaeon]